MVIELHRPLFIHIQARLSNRIFGKFNPNCAGPYTCHSKSTTLLVGLLVCIRAFSAGWGMGLAVRMMFVTLQNL